MAALTDERLEVRCQSLDTLGARGDAARPALPHVLPLLEDTAWQVRSAAARALAALGREDAEVCRALLVRALEDSHVWVRHAALAGLATPGLATADVQAPLVTALTEDGDRARRLRALQALSRLKLFSEPVLQALARAAKDADWTVRAEAVRVLGGSGREGARGVRAVCEALSDADPTVRETACEALARLTPLEAEELEALRQRALDIESQVRMACAKALGRLPPGAQAHTLQTLLRDADERVREAAVLALGGAGRSRLPLALWVDCLEDPSPAVRQAAESVLADESHAGTDLAPVLLDSLQRSPRVRAGAVHVLGRTHVRGSSFTEPLSRTILEISDQRARDLAAHLASADEPASLPQVLEGLRHRQARIRHRAARALGFFVLDSAVATRQVPVLDQALRDASERVRLAATESLGRMGPRALPAYPGLIRRLYERTQLVPEHARDVVLGLKSELHTDWWLSRYVPVDHPESLFTRLSRNLSPDQAERLRGLCLAHERWHLQCSRLPPTPPSDKPCTLAEAAERAALAAVAHHASRRSRDDRAADARDRQREFVWMVGQLHTIGLASLLTPPAP